MFLRHGEYGESTLDHIRALVGRPPDPSRTPSDWACSRSTGDSCNIPLFPGSVPVSIGGAPAASVGKASMGEGCDGRGAVCSSGSQGRMLEEERSEEHTSELQSLMRIA